MKLNSQPSVHVAALLLRVALGVLFLAHAFLKILVFTLPGTVSFFGSLGLPPALAYSVLALEVAGGVALLVGYRVSLVAIPLIADLLGAIVMVHGKNGWLFTSKGGGWEFLALWIVALVVLALLGDGKWSVMRARAERTRSRSTALAAPE
ncbi:DoxX family membrane protein [Pandoraea fibrosis]|uniref:DoxX family membrane protein n=1 Tax=Pandoraea fibrosis TaxID=1891094 RepID=A0ABX6HQW3_9BURK|nr:DoxX family protein [Pandoraea fibrosis]QHE93228.1 DoxX family membrane protein [Pandoraea fibrosis]QHF13213.1 DoxX family membrane protein [Pandoraea fibrosis]